MERLSSWLFWRPRHRRGALEKNNAGSGSRLAPRTLQLGCFASGTCGVPSLPLWQHDKLRPIDDYSRSGVNEASRLNPVSAASGGWGGVDVDSHGFQLPSVPLFTAPGATFHGFPVHAFHDFIIWHAS